MARIIAIDYGTKRCGIAVTDNNQIIANPLKTVHSSELLFFIKEYCSKEIVHCIVVGKPKRMNNEDSEVEVNILAFIKQLSKELPNIKIVRFDERFTSKIAQQTIASSGKNKKARQNKELTDLVSATLILQSYLEFVNNVR